MLPMLTWERARAIGVDDPSSRADHRVNTRVNRIVLSVAAVVALVVPAAAQDDTDVARLEELKAERQTVLDQAVESIEQIDTATASVEDIADAVDRLNEHVRFHQSQFEDAERALASAERAVDDARAAQDRIETEAIALREHIVDLAVSSFTGESVLRSEDVTELALSDDPGEAARIRHLLQIQTGTLSDSLDRLRALEVEAEALVATEAAAVADAEAGLALVDERAFSLRRALDRQQVFLLAAETRLEARLAEAAFLADRDAELAAEIRERQQSINRRLAAVALENGVEIPKPVDLDDIVTVVFPEHDTEFSIEVHEAIAEATEALFLEAFESGVDLAGWGYRPIQHQIELRAAHCGTSDEAIWHMPAFDCAPPTARPGFSKHEQGRAIDFTWGGATIATTESAGYAWLVAHAPKYGFVNLEGEPWHWSIGA